MILVPANVSLLSFDIQEVNFNFQTKRKRPKQVSILPQHVDYEFSIKKRKKVEQYKILFNLNIKLKSEMLSLGIKGFAIFEFKENLDDGIKQQLIYGNLIPSIYTTLRGIIFMLTYNSPFRILLPMVNFIETYKNAGMIKKR